MNEPKRFVIPPNARDAKCKSCGAPIAWVKTTAGKNMPVDTSAEHYGESHFAHCPNADAHRKPR